MDNPLDLIRKYWRFDDGQQHTHSWHDREDFIDKVLRPYLESQAATIARLTAEKDKELNRRATVESKMFDAVKSGEPVPVGQVREWALALGVPEEYQKQAATYKAERDAAVRDLDAYQVAAAIVKVKCEECWNLTGMVDAEMHAILEFIHRSLQNAARPSSEVGGG